MSASARKTDVMILHPPSHQAGYSLVELYAYLPTFHAIHIQYIDARFGRGESGGRVW